MPLTLEQRAKLEELRVSEVRLHYERAGMDNHRTVATLLDGGMLRRDVGEWLAEKERESQTIQVRAFDFARATFRTTIIIGVAGIIVAIIIALLGK